MVTLPNGKRRLEFSRGSLGKAISIPCGRCIGCRLERSRQWAVRILHESQLHEESSFLTLTYSDEHLPSSRSLVVGHCQLFLKRLRARLAPKRVRFFLCGEYGERTARPHYHAILFGYGFPDKIPLEGKKGLFFSQELVETWGLGHCSVGSVTFESASYVASYATKKILGEAAVSHYKGRKPEFLLMSRRPGIGRGWIDSYSSDVYPSDEVIVRGFPSRPPRYYDQVFAARDAAVFEAIRASREAKALELNTIVNSYGVEEPGWPSAKRLRVREVCARAKLALKSRSLE